MGTTNTSIPPRSQAPQQGETDCLSAKIAVNVFTTSTLSTAADD